MCHLHPREKNKLNYCKACDDFFNALPSTSRHRAGNQGVDHKALFAISNKNHVKRKHQQGSESPQEELHLHHTRTPLDSSVNEIQDSLYNVSLSTPYYVKPRTSAQNHHSFEEILQHRKQYGQEE